VITYVDVRFSFFKIFTPVKFIADKSQLTEDPAPQVKKKIATPAKTCPEHKWKNYSGEKNDHKHSEHDAHPYNI
jgi:hypothetical protein